MRLAIARFPFQKTFETFDFKSSLSIDVKLIRELGTGRLFLGPPRVGKTHLAVALGITACKYGHRMLLTAAMGLLTTLGKALSENRLEDRIKLLAQPELLIIDEIGYIRIDWQGANLFFQLLSRRYEKGLIAHQ